jgi:3-hydroxyisobutyrate dehydrogenase-like beta-hydroxyacid dehydrogenase
MHVGFAGLGQMGIGMARNLIKAGHQVTVYNRTRSRAEELSAEGVKIADSPGALSDAGIVITMLADDSAVEAVVFGGVLDRLPRGGLHVSMSTISGALSQQLAAAHKERGQNYLAAPVFGRPEAAAAAKLFVVAAGPQDQFERCSELFSILGQRTFYVGEEAHRANVIKLSGNFLIASMLESLGEATALVRKYGMDPREYIELLTSTLFPAPIYQNYGSIIAQEKYRPAGFRLRLGLKDVRLALAAAESVACPMPFASVIRDHLLTGISHGLEDADWSALAQVVAQNAGLK